MRLRMASSNRNDFFFQSYFIALAILVYPPPSYAEAGNPKPSLSSYGPTEFQPRYQTPSEEHYSYDRNGEESQVPPPLHFNSVSPLPSTVALEPQMPPSMHFRSDSLATSTDYQPSADDQTSGNLVPPPGLFVPGPRRPVPPLSFRVSDWRNWKGPTAQDPWEPAPPLRSSDYRE